MLPTKILSYHKAKSLGKRSLVTLPCITRTFNNRVINNIVHPPYDIQSQNITYTDLIWSGMDVKGHLPAMTCGISGRVLSHGELQEEALRFSNTLQGMPEVKTLGLLTPNCVEYAMIIAGAMHAGVTVTTLNPVYTPSEIAHQLKAASVDILIAGNSLQDKVNQSLELYPDVSHVLYVDAECQNNEKDLRLNDRTLPLYQFLSANPAKNHAKVDTKKDIAILPFSSGTTGPPKGVMISQHNLVMQTASTSSDGEFFYRAFGNFQDVTIATLPMFHIFGLGVTMTGALWSGTNQVTIPKFESQRYIDLMVKYRPTFLHIVPPIVNFLASSPNVTSEMLSSLRQVNCGAAPCGMALINKFRLKAPRATFKEGWGMTETAGGATSYAGSYNTYIPGSVQGVLPNLRMRMVDADTDEIKGAMQEGEIQIKGEGIMMGYFNNQEATDKTFTKDGWMKTGDVGYFTEEGIIFISDRIKELIKVNGLQVAPAELEDVLRQLDGVDDVAVVGVENDRTGQLPKAFIVKSGDLTVEKVRSWMSEKLSAHKQLDGGVVFIQTIPKSAAGKILRRELVGK